MTRPSTSRSAAVVAVGLAALLASAATAATQVSAPAHAPVAAVASPGISAPANVVVGEASGTVVLPVRLSAKGTQTVSVTYSVSGGNCNFPVQAASGTLTFAPGQTVKDVTLTVNNCTTSGMQWTSLVLSSPVNATLVDTTTLVGVVGDANPVATPGLYVRDAFVGTRDGSISVPVLLGGTSGAPSNSTVTVAYTTTAGSAVPGSDYTTTKGTLTFAPGQTVENVVVPIVDRTSAAPTRRFTLTLSAPKNAVLTNSTGVITIEASGAKAVASPRISAPADVVAGAVDGYVDLPVTLNAPGTQTVSVSYSVGGGNCNFPTQSSSGTLTFTPGQTVRVVRLIVNNCAISGLHWTALDLSTPVNATIAKTGALVAVVGDAGTVQTPGLYVRDAVVDNLAGSIAVPVLLGGPAGTPSLSTVTVHYTTTAGSAVPGTDYTTTSGTLTYGPGQTVHTVLVPILARTGAAPTRRFSVTLSAVTNGVITHGAGVVTIEASGATAIPTPRISAPPNVVVGEADGYVDLPVTLAAPGTKVVSVDYSVSGGNCNFPTQAASGTLTFTPGQTVQVVRLIVNDCTTAGMSWTALDLSTPVNATIVVPGTLVAVVGDADPVAKPGLYVRDAVVSNAAGVIAVPVLLGGVEGAPSHSTVTVAYTTTAGSALAGTDYTATSGTLTFGPGQTVQDVLVPIVARQFSVPTRQFAVTLSAPKNAVVSDGVGVVTIEASGEGAVSSAHISAPVNAVVAKTSGYVDLPVTLAAPGTKTVSVTYAASGGNCNFAVQAANGTLTFLPGETVQVVRMIINDCTGVTTSQTFTLALSAPVNATITRAATVVTVLAAPTHPHAPTNVVAVAGQGSATVTFNVPTSDGGDPLNGYVVIASPGGATVSGLDGPLTVTGLTAGAPYTFVVKAKNPEGTSPASAPSLAVTPS